jgi:predicted nucleic acid-binding protein
VAHYYLDSSALAKRYVAESGTRWVRRLHAPTQGHQLYTVRITGAEVVAALMLRSRVGTLTSSATWDVIRRFKCDFQSRYQLIEVSQRLVEFAMSLTETHPLRGYDAVQVAAAITLQRAPVVETVQAITFVSADARLNAAAAAEGLLIEDPTDHE